MPNTLFNKPSVSAPLHSHTLLWLVAIGFFMQMLNGTIVNTALPGIAQELGKSPLRMQWVLVSYMLVNALLIPCSGWLADHFGTRRVFASAITLFIIGSMICAAAPSITILILGRIVQGAGAAVMVPVGRLAVLRSYPKEHFLRALNFVMIPGLIGQVIGPTLGGWLVQSLSWHWVFLVNVPVGVIGVIATLKAMPDLRAPERDPFDFSGYLFLAVAMVTFSLSLDGFASLGLQRAVVLLLLIAGITTMVSYWLHAQRVQYPLFTPALFKVLSFKIGILGNLFARIGSSSMPFMLPLLMQVGMGFGPAKAGMMMLPVAIAAIFAKQIATPLIGRFGYRTVLIANTLILGGIIALFALMPQDPPLITLLVLLACFGAVNSLQFTAMNTVTLKDLESDTASSGNTMLSMTQMIASSLGISVASAVLQAFNDMLAGSETTGVYAIGAFRLSFITIGAMTCLAALIFWQLNRDGRGAPGAHSRKQASS